MKIWVTGTRGIPDVMGGVETHCAQLYPRLATRGHHITVACRRHYMPRHCATSHRGVTLYISPAPRSPHLEAIIHTIGAIIAARRHGADIVHIHAIGPALAAPLARLLGMKVVVTHHGFDYERAKWGPFARFMLRAGERMAAIFANGIIAVAPHIASRLTHTYRLHGKLTCIPNGIPSQQNTADPADPPYILAVGRFVEEKGFHTLLEAWRLSALARAGLRLIIVGNSDTPTPYSIRLQELAKQPGVEMPGKITGSKLHDLYSRAALFVIPSTHEGLPITLLEAMSHSLPVIASDIPANRLSQLPPQAFFSPDDPNALAEKITAFFPVTTPRISYDLTPYNWDNIADAVSSLYLTLSPHTS